jgi:hypothetical protein
MVAYLALTFGKLSDSVMVAYLAPTVGKLSDSVMVAILHSREIELVVMLLG